MRFLYLLTIACALAACSRTPPGCDNLYVILPDNYVIDLAAGAKVLLDPSAQEFALFCSAMKAQRAINEAGVQGNWRVYGLDGDFDEIVRELGAERYILRRPAQVRDWAAVQ